MRVYPKELCTQVTLLMGLFKGMSRCSANQHCNVQVFSQTLICRIAKCLCNTVHVTVICSHESLFSHIPSLKHLERPNLTTETPILTSRLFIQQSSTKASFIFETHSPQVKFDNGTVFAEKKGSYVEDRYQKHQTA